VAELLAEGTRLEQEVNSLQLDREDALLSVSTLEEANLALQEESVAKEEELRAAKDLLAGLGAEREAAHWKLEGETAALVKLRKEASELRAKLEAAALQTASAEAERGVAVAELESKLREAEEYQHHLEEQHAQSAALVDELVSKGKQVEHQLAAAHDERAAERAAWEAQREEALALAAGEAAARSRAEGEQRAAAGSLETLRAEAEELRGRLAQAAGGQRTETEAVEYQQHLEETLHESQAHAAEAVAEAEALRRALDAQASRRLTRACARPHPPAPPRAEPACAASGCSVRRQRRRARRWSSGFRARRLRRGRRARRWRRSARGSGRRRSTGRTWSVSWARPTSASPRRSTPRPAPRHRRAGGRGAVA